MLYRLLIIIFLHLAVLASVPAQAAKSNSKQNSKQKVTQVQSKKTISKSTAINVAKSEVIGKVLSAKLIKSKGPAVYRVKILVGDSRVRTVFVDGVTAKVIRIN